MVDRPPPQAEMKFDNMTRQDLKKIQKSMKRPQFMGLLNEYMIEISDPKNKNQYDQYLKQMQRERELPKHMKIVELKPHFCFRTFISSAKNKKHQMKFFINMCSSQYLQKPACEPTPDQDGKMGFNWKIPNSIGKIRYDQDRHGSPCQVVDIAFHPQNFDWARKKQFKEMMINIALEASERLLGQRKQTLSRDYVILQKVICKGQDGKPALLPIRYIEGKIYNKGQGPSAQAERDNEGRQTKLQKQLNKQKQDYQNEKNKGKKENKDEQQKQEQIEQQKSKLIVDMETGVQRPKYSTIFTYPIDYSEYIESDALKKRKKIPSAFNIQFLVPRVQSMQEISGQKLQINDKNLLLQIGQKYFIDLQLEDFKLKYSLLTANAKAKYDKKKKSLRIIIPVDQNQKYEPEPQPEPSLVTPTDANNQNTIIQNQTWKNKVLQIPESSVSVHFLDNQQNKQQAPALIQQIDDEDQIQQNNTTPKQTVQKQIQQQDENAQPYNKRPQKFKLSKYYKQNQPQKTQQSYQKLPYLFQETPQKVLLVFQMKNYQKEHLTMVHFNKSQFLIEWKQSFVKQNDHNQIIKYNSLKLAEEFINKVLKIEIIERVGFAAFVIFKEIGNNSKYWEKLSVSQINYGEETDQLKYNSFKLALTQIQNKQAQQFKLKQLQNALILEQQNKIKYQVSQQKQRQIEEKQQSIPRAKNEKYSLEEIVTGQRQVDNKKGIQLGLKKQNIFNNMQPQFIYFTVPFIQGLD